MKGLAVKTRSKPLPPCAERGQMEGGGELAHHGARSAGTQAVGGVTADALSSSVQGRAVGQPLADLKFSPRRDCGFHSPSSGSPVVQAGKDRLLATTIRATVKAGIGHLPRMDGASGACVTSAIARLRGNIRCRIKTRHAPWFNDLVQPPDAATITILATGSLDITRADASVNP